MKFSLKHFVRHLVNKTGFDIVRKESFPPGISSSHKKIISAAQPFTLTSPYRIHSLIESVEYVVKNDIPGAIVECGVWKGGSIMAVAETLLCLNQTDRNLYLFDTFEGMVEPSKLDVTNNGRMASEKFKKLKRDNNDGSDWCYASLDEVRQSVLSTGYEHSRIHFVKGKVEETIPDSAPDNISILRLDTDWYESTKHELIHLFPRLSRGGVIIIDDYGKWLGARKAVDEYFVDKDIKIFLMRIDSGAKIGVKI